MPYWRGLSRKWFIISYNHLNMTGRLGPSERRSRPWLREWEGPAAVAVGRIAPTGRTAPKAPVGQPCLDDELFPWLTTPIWHWPKQKKCRMILRQITMSLENVTTLAGQVNTDPVRYSCRIDKSPLIFDPLGNGSPVLHIDNQKVSRINGCQEVGS